MGSVLLLRRDYATDAAIGVGYVTSIAGDEVHVDMEDTLTCGFVYVDAYVVAIGVKLLVNPLLYVLQHHIHRLALVIGQVEVAGYVALGYDKRMTRCHGVTIEEGYAGGRLTNHFHAAREVAERTFASLLPR